MTTSSDAEPDVSGVTVSAGIEIVCTTCYLKGTATGELSVPSNFSVTQAISNVKNQVETTVQNLTDYAEGWAKNITEEASPDVMDFDFDALEFPRFDYDFTDVSLPAIPEANLRFTFDGFELYMLIDTTLSLGTTYTLNLFNSGRETSEAVPIGLYITEDLQLGLIFTVDLILAAHGTVDVSSGFHLLMDDGFAIDIALFGDDASGITL